MKEKTKKQIKRNGIIFVSVTSLILAYGVGKQLGYDKGVFDVLSDFADKGYIEKK